MAGELCLKHTASGATIKAAILDVDRAKQWNGAAMASVSGLTDAQWVAGLIDCPEQQTADATPTARYVGDLPAALAATGEEYVVEFYAGAAPTPGQRIIGIQSLAPRSGYKLAADGLDSISTAAPTGAPGTWNWRQRIMWVFHFLFGATTMTSTQAKVHDFENNLLSTHALSDDQTTQTFGKGE